MSRPVIGRDYVARRVPRTLEEAFGYGQRGGLHAGRHRAHVSLDAWIGAGVAAAIVVMLLGSAL